VYLAAFVPGDGVSIAEQAMGDTASLLTGTVVIDPDAGVASLSDEVIDVCFYADCEPQDIAFARKRLRADPLAPLMTPLVLSGEQSRSLPRIYIECSRDATLTPVHQRAIRAGGRWAHVYHLDTGHSPFLSAPECLARQLLASLAFAR
jgi:pimeloyl-ACP methyl ester carboxylesterase